MSRTVLITGGSRGIGYATAELFAAHGWNVALCSRDAAQAESAAARIAKSTGNANVMGLGADVGDKAAVDRLFAETAKRFPTLDALVNNAGVLHVGDVFDLSDDAIASTFRINIHGVLHCSRMAFQKMRERGGSIVNVSSLAGIGGTEKIPGLWAYTASKFAVTGFTEGMAVEGKPFNIRVNCVAPGATDTDMLHKNFPGYKAMATPADIAKVIYYLSDTSQSAILSGATIPVFSNS